LLCRIGEQAAHAESEKQTISMTCLSHRERVPQRVSLGARQPVQTIQVPTQLVDRGEGKVTLGLNAEQANNAEIPRSLGCLVQQGRLSDSRFPSQNEGSATTKSELPEKLIEFLAHSIEHRHAVRLSDLSGVDGRLRTIPTPTRDKVEKGVLRRRAERLSHRAERAAGLPVKVIGYRAAQRHTRLPGLETRPWG
jgi:hypothetical protein